MKILTAYHKQVKSSWIEILEKKRLKLLSTLVPQIKMQNLMIRQLFFMIVLGILIKPDIMGYLNNFHQHCHMVKASNAFFNSLIPKKKRAQSSGNVYKILAEASAEDPRIEDTSWDEIQWQ